jgi:hypothetical protein
MARNKKPSASRENLELAPAQVPREISWRAAEYEFVEKNVVWYVGIGLVGFVLIVVALWQRNFFFAVFIAIAAIVLIAMGRKRPPVVEFRVNEEGVKVGKQFSPFEQFQNFSLRERPGRLHELVLTKKTLVAPFVKIPVDGRAAQEVEELLKTKLPEVEHQDSFIDIIAEWLGF